MLWAGRLADSSRSSWRLSSTVKEKLEWIPPRNMWSVGALSSLIRYLITESRWNSWYDNVTVRVSIFGCVCRLLMTPKYRTKRLYLYKDGRNCYCHWKQWTVFKYCLKLLKFKPFAKYTNNNRWSFKTNSLLTDMAQ